MLVTAQRGAGRRRRGRARAGRSPRPSTSSGSPRRSPGRQSGDRPRRRPRRGLARRSTPTPPSTWRSRPPTPPRSPRGSRNAGAIFVGPYAPVSLGDYSAGSNHVLPTGGLRLRTPAGCRCRPSCGGIQVVELHARGPAPRSPTHVVTLADGRGPARATARRSRRASGRRVHRSRRASAADDLATPAPLRADLRGRARRTGRRSSTCRSSSTPTRTPTRSRRSSPTPSSRRSRRPRRGLNRYPDREFTALRDDLAAYLTRTTGVALDPEQIWAGNGSNEVLQHLVQAFGGPGPRPRSGFTPSYSMHPIIYARTTGTTWIDGRRGVAATGAPLRPRRRRSAAAQVRAAPRRTSSSSCSPNNPTGTALGLDVVEAVYDAAPDARRRRRRGVRRVRPRRDAVSALTLLAGPPAARRHPHDEQGVRPGRGPARLPRRRPGAGRRAAAGAAAVPPVLPDPGRRPAPPWPTPTCCCATVEAIKAQRDRIVDRERRRWACAPVPSDANFVLFGGLADEAATWQALLDAGVLVRDVGHRRGTCG